MGHRLRRIDGRGAAADDQNLQLLGRFDRLRYLGQRALGGEQPGRNLACMGRLLGARGEGREADQHQKAKNGPALPVHYPPPAMSALASLLFPRVPLFFAATSLYHENTHAAADIMTIPEILITKCIPAPPDTSAITKCPAKARNTPRQKISSECWPHRISGRSHGDFSPGQSFGRQRSVSAASARKCANRRTSRSVLLIGYIHCSMRRGTRCGSCGRYQVNVTQNEAAR